jgi:hypothetical protein
VGFDAGRLACAVRSHQLQCQSLSGRHYNNAHPRSDEHREDHLGWADRIPALVDQGLYSLELRSFRLREEVGPTALGKIDTALSSKDDIAARIRAISISESNLIGSASVVGRVQWTAGSDQTQTGGIVGDDAAKVYVAAPIPRIEGVPGRIKPGESVLAWIQARVRMAAKWKQDFPSIVSLYSHFAERAIVDVTATGGPELCGAVADVEVAAPDGSTVLGPTAVWRTADSILAQALGLWKATKLVVPVRWNSPSCRPA